MADRGGESKVNRAVSGRRSGGGQGADGRVACARTNGATTLTRHTLAAWAALASAAHRTLAGGFNGLDELWSLSLTLDHSQLRAEVHLGRYHTHYRQEGLLDAADVAAVESLGSPS